MSPSLKITVYGSPAPAGSKRAVPLGGKKGGRWVVTDANKRSKPWQKDVKQVAGEAMNGRPLMEGPLSVVFRFYRARPKGHRNKSGLSAEGRRNPYPTGRPDVLKLARGIEDALTKVVWRDDAQIVDEMLSKDWGTPERVEIVVYELPKDVRA